MASTSSIAAVGGSGQTGIIVGKNQEATCYVGNLEERVTDSILWELFVQVAPVVSLHIPRDRLNQTHSGYGFVELQSESDAEYASKILHGIKLYGKALKVNRASADKKNLDVGSNLFIGNLDPLVDDLLLTETFKAFGNVISSKIAREGESGGGASRGFGFVSFDSFEAADAAIEAMSGQFLCNRPITVSYAFKKDGKGERHGTAAERLLAAQAKKTGLVNQTPAQQTSTPQLSGYRPASNMPFPMPPPLPSMIAPGMSGMMPPGMMIPPTPGQFGFAPPPMGFDPNYFAAMQQHMIMMQQQQQQVQNPQAYQPPQPPQNLYPYPYPYPNSYPPTQPPQ